MITQPQMHAPKAPHEVNIDKPAVDLKNFTILAFLQRLFQRWFQTSSEPAKSNTKKASVDK